MLTISFPQPDASFHDVSKWMHIEVSLQVGIPYFLFRSGGRASRQETATREARPCPLQRCRRQWPSCTLAGVLSSSCPRPLTLRPSPYLLMRSPQISLISEAHSYRPLGGLDASVFSGAECGFLTTPRGGSWAPSRASRGWSGQRRRACSLWRGVALSGGLLECDVWRVGCGSRSLPEGRNSRGREAVSKPLCGTIHCSRCAPYSVA